MQTVTSVDKEATQTVLSVVWEDKNLLAFRLCDSQSQLNRHRLSHTPNTKSLRWSRAAVSGTEGALGSPFHSMSFLSPSPSVQSFPLTHCPKTRSRLVCEELQSFRLTWNQATGEVKAHPKKKKKTIPQNTHWSERLRRDERASGKNSQSEPSISTSHKKKVLKICHNEIII